MSDALGRTQAENIEDWDLIDEERGGNAWYWTTREGKKLRVQEMETSHIKNCIRMLESQIIDTWAVHGDEPKYGAGGYADSVMNDHNDKIEHRIDKFKAELKKRNQ